MSAESSPTSPRSRLRLSIRGLMVLVLVLGGGLGWLVYRARVQREAVAAILRAGGSVRYDFQYRDGAYDETGAPPWFPAWLADAVGIDLLARARGVRLSGGQANAVHDGLMADVAQLDGLWVLDLNGCAGVTDAGLAELGGLRDLRELDLCFTRVEGPGLSHLSGLRRLRSLNLMSLPLADDDLAHLAGLTALEDLKIASPQLTDGGLAHLAGLGRLASLSFDATGVTTLAPLARLTGLASLSLRGSRVDDAGLVPASALTGLRELALPGAPITDAGIGHLRGLTGLEQLDLSDTRIGDPAMPLLGGLSRLLVLRLDGTGLTDAGMAHLGRLRRLDRLYVSRTGITDAGLDSLAGLICRLVRVSGTNVTAAGVDAARERIPWMEVDPVPHD